MSTQTQPEVPQRDATRSDRLLALTMLAIGFGAIWFGRDISPMARVFPTTMAVVLLVLSALLLCKAFIRRSHEAAHEAGSVPRRLLLVAVILVWGFTLNWLGFIASSVAGVAVLALIGHFQGWTPRRALTYGLALLATVAFFYLLFDVLLDVPLPAGTLWQRL